MFDVKDFLAFARQQSGPYFYFSADNCAVGQYVKARGLAKNPQVGGHYYIDDNGNFVSFPEGLARTIAGDDHGPPVDTWEALTERLMAYLA